MRRLIDSRGVTIVEVLIVLIAVCAVLLVFGKTL
jgi:Tfp pilus assembly protein FimT